MGSNRRHLDRDKLLQRLDDDLWEKSQAGVEYISPMQHGGFFGLILRQYFNTSLPSDLTSGNNVSDLIYSGLKFDDSANRAVAIGSHRFRKSAQDEEHAEVELTGTSGSGNLFLNMEEVTFSSGWVDYVRP